MVDEDYWNASNQMGFDFGDLDSWEACTGALPKFSAAVRSTISASAVGLEQFHTKGFDEYVQKESICDVPSMVSPSSESLPSLLTKGSLLVSPVKRRSVNGNRTPQQTVSNMILGQEHCLEQYRSKEEKVAFLDAAIRSHDGNVILAALLFLKRTLKASIFHLEILKRPEAVNHYLGYLEMDREYSELDNMLLMLGKDDDAALLKYKSAIEVPHPETKIKRLENCLNTHFQPGSVNPLFVDAVAEHTCLLKRQLPVDEDDARQQREGSNELFVMSPRDKPLFDMSLISTLSYCCSYHYDLSENNLASPVAIRKKHHLTDKQFVWTALSALAKMHQWNDLENLFLNKTWLGATKMKCCIGFANAVPVIAKASAPAEVLLKYIRLVEDVEERLNLAKRFKFHALVLEILKNTRDRQSLLAYKSEISPKSLEFIEVEELLQSSSVKWKN